MKTRTSKVATSELTAAAAELPSTSVGRVVAAAKLRPPATGQQQQTTGGAAAFDNVSSSVSIVINNKMSIAYFVSDACWESLGIVGQLVIPDTRTLLGRRIQMVQILTFATIALAGILVQVYTDSDVSQDRNAKYNDIMKPFSLITDIYAVLDALRQEASVFFLNTADSYDDFLTKSQTVTRTTDTTLMWIQDWPIESDFFGIPEQQRINLTSSTQLSIAVRNQRNLRKSDNATTELDIINFYYSIIETLTTVMYNTVLRTARFPGWSELIAFQHLFEMETSGQLLHFIGKKFLLEKRITPLSDPVFQTLFQARIRYEELTTIASHDSEFSQNQIATNITQQENYRQFASSYSGIIAMDYNKEQLTVAGFDDAFVKTQSAVDWLQQVLTSRITLAVQSDTQSWSRAEIVSIVLLIVASVICFADLFVHYQGIWRLQAHVIDTNNRAELLDRAAMILYDCIPRAMINTVRNGEALYPRRAADLCVVMIDINTASLQEDLEPPELLELLTQYFLALEDTISKFNCFKIDVICDAFCLGSGAGEAHGTDHVTEMVFMALQLQDRAGTILIKEGSDDSLRLRVGIHVGPGLSHVLHLQLPRMCIFGEAVEVASLIHATSLPLRVQTSSAVYDRLVNCEDIEFTRRGTLTVQGARDIVVFWVAWADDQPDEQDRLSRVSTPSIRYSYHAAGGSDVAVTSMMDTHDMLENESNAGD